MPHPLLPPCAAAAVVVATVLSVTPPAPAATLTRAGEGFVVNGRDGAWKLRFFGRIFLDGARYDGAFNAPADGAPTEGRELRSTSVFLSGQLPRDLSIYVQYEVDRRDLILAYLTHRRSRRDLVLGLTKEPLGFEWQSNRRANPTLERPLVQTLLPGASFGLLIRRRGRAERTTLSGGAFVDEEDSDQVGASGRFTWVPVRQADRDRLLHVGFSAALKDLGGEPWRRRSAAGVRASPVRIATTGTTFAADTAATFGLELATTRGPLAAQAEVVVQRVGAVDPDHDATYDAAYVQGSYFVTGEQRRYQLGRGRFGEVTPRRRRGAVEILGRWDHLDLDSGRPGTRTESFTLGVTWTLSTKVRVMLNAVHARVGGRSAADVVAAERTGRALTARLHVYF